MSAERPFDRYYARRLPTASLTREEADLVREILGEWSRERPGRVSNPPHKRRDLVFFGALQALRCGDSDP